ncbi:MAG: hypothetical protein JSW66_10115 [Phycisphaerales bacterium]|nr:MAG: hypothetical protein JSW66_10115 [Phycisphaerales bacterium]
MRRTQKPQIRDAAWASELPILPFCLLPLIVGIAFSRACGAVGEDAQRPTVIVVVGAAGTPEFGAQFAQWAGLWKEACERGGAQFAAIGLEETGGSDDRALLRQMLAGQSRQGAAALWLVFLGHGTFDGRTAKFNLRGPDVSADDLAEWLRSFSRDLVIINAASSSAPFLNTLPGPNRVVITATKSGFEQNYARFGGYLAKAIAESQADLDKDGQTSLLEAFLTASARVEEFYSGAGRLATEHSLLDDNGDGLGTRADWFRGIRPVQEAADGASLDGYRAHQFHLVRSEAENRMPPQLRRERDRLELDVVKLRDMREDLSDAEYFPRLEKLLCEIAQIYERTDTAEGDLE